MKGKNEQSKAEWTIMVYIAADDLLSNFAIESLKQLKMAAGRGVVVAAQLDVDGPIARQGIKRYVFDDRGSPTASIDEYIVKILDPTTNMIDPRNLTAFIDSVYSDSRCDAHHYCLVLWGHGPELLAESAPAAGQPLKNPPADGSTKLYLTPRQLAQALKDSRLGTPGGKKLDIIALDACSSSLAEIAAEVRAYANVLVASQEDVPDMSFPYGSLLQLFRATPNQVQEICKTAVNNYLVNYQDYVFGANTGTSKVSLSAVDLTNLTTITQPVKDLAAALLYATGNDKLSSLVLEARQASHGFVAGLFVDLVDFCEEMLNQLTGNSIKNQDLETACRKVIDSFPARGNSTAIIANAALEPTQCHGLSIYFPFLTDQDMQEMDINLVKGGDILTKGGDILTKGGDILTKMRRQRIAEIEADYPVSELSKLTTWYCFIRNGWSRLLAQQLQPEELDVHYSAQQCTVNLLSAAAKKPCSSTVSARQTAQPPDKAVQVALAAQKVVAAKKAEGRAGKPNGHAAAGR